MAKRTYANWLGKIDVSAALKDLKNTQTVTDGLTVIKNLMLDVYAGVGNIGASDKDEEAVVRVLTAFKNKYNINSSVVDNIINSWDSASDTYVNAGGLDLEDRVTNDYNSLANAVKQVTQPAGQKPTQPNTSTTGGAGAPGGGGGIGSRGDSGTSTNNNGSTNTGTGSTGSGTKNPTTVAPPTTTTNTVTTNTVTPTIEKNGKEEEITPPKFASAEEAAAKFGIDYNLENILADYNKSTNDYYDAAVLEQEKNRTKYLQTANNYANRIMNEYLDSYANAAATASGRGTNAATALMTDLGAQQTNAANDLGMLQSVNNLNAYRKAELENNPSLAETYYNQLGTYLSDLSTAEYAANVNKYIKELDAYGQTYASNRLISAAEAEAAANKYAGLARYNAYQAQTQQESTTSAQKMYDYYKLIYGDKAAANMVINNYGIGG